MIVCILRESGRGRGCVCEQWISEKVRDTINYSRVSIETMVMSVWPYVLCVRTSHEMDSSCTFSMVRFV